MKSLMFATSAIALVMGAAACSESASTTETASIESPADIETGTEYADYRQDQTMTNSDQETIKAEQKRAVFVLASDEVLASDLIGASVLNPVGDDIATVADVWIGEDGDNPKLIVREGGVAGVGGTLHAISFDTATIEPVAGDDEPNVRVTYSEESLEGLPEFEQDGLDDFRLASEAIGTTVGFSTGDAVVRVNDFVMKHDGTPEYVVVADGMAGAEQYVIKSDSLKIQQGDGDGTLVVDMTTDDFARAKVMADYN